ncbi:MAG: hypothetical protein NTW50_00460 [Candidatus Berkelbacteria bacterium]|nr:hypothetical protein [Candidatus Berkelbacteria bacterium]
MKHLPVQPTVTYSTQIDDTKVIISYDFYLKKYDENTKNLDDKIKSKLFLDAMDQEINSTKNSNADISKIEKLTNSYGHVNLRDILTENNGNEICLYSVEIGQCLEYFTIHDYGFQAAPLAGTGQIIYFTPDGIMFHKDEWIS